MKRQTIIRTATALAIALCTVATANAQFGKLKGLANKAKEKVENKVENKVKQEKKKVENKIENKVKQEVDEKVTSKVKDKVKKSTGVDLDGDLSVTGAISDAAYAKRGPAPWPMNGEDTYNGMTMEEFVYNIAEIPQEELDSLRDALFARFLSNMELYNKGASGDLKQRIFEENKEFFNLYNGWIEGECGLINCNGMIENGKLVFRPEGEGYYMLMDRDKRVIAFIFNHGAEYQKFCNKNGGGIFLNETQLAAAKDIRDRFHRYKEFSHGLFDVMPQSGWAETNEGDKDVDAKMRYLFGRCAEVANALDVAIPKNSAENIEKRARPKSGSMESSLKAKALAAAKTQSDRVVDVIIQSDSWDVKKKGGVISHRSVYGYWILEDDLGKLCVPRMWTETYEGNGKYGNLRPGGAGLEEPFYLK